MVKPLRFEDVWHPKLGAPYGNRNAVKPSLHTPMAQLETRLRAIKARLRRILREIP
jgi:hypothetical protein